MRGARNDLTSGCSAGVTTGPAPGTLLAYRDATWGQRHPSSLRLDNVPCPGDLSPRSVEYAPPREFTFFLRVKINRNVWGVNNNLLALTI